MFTILKYLQHQVPYDNVPIKSFWETLKNGLIRHQKYTTKKRLLLIL